MAVHRCFPSNVMELERICQEEWDKLPKSSCAKLVQMNKKTRSCNCCQRGFYKVLN
ncbi:hypothetical protein LDENG_00077890 [Lucifuga dentata]|nr:hypothetical protein LDENG_00077890 [Lucifuga dentata]